MSTIKKEIFSRIVELNTRQEKRVELAVNDDLQKLFDKTSEIVTSTVKDDIMSSFINAHELYTKQDEKTI